MPDVYKLILFLSVFIGLLLRLNFAPNFHKIYFDEDRYLSYAVSFAKFNKTVSIDIATPQKIVMGIPDDAARTTVPVINGWVLKTFGYSEQILFQSAKLFSTLQIFLVFILAYLLFKNYLAASFSALAMAFLPTNIYWSSSISLDAFAVTFALISLIGSTWYARAPSIRSAFFTAASFFLLLGVRIESFIFLPVIVSAIFYIRKTEKRTLFTKKELPFIVLFMSLIAFRTLLSISVIGQTWCCAEALPLEAFAPNYLVRNLLVNILHFFTRPEFPLGITMLALIALVGEKGKEKFILGLWIITYFVVYSTYYAGNFFSYEFSGSYGRYFLMLIPPTVILASLALTRIIEKYKQKKTSLAIILFFIFLTSVPMWLSYKSLISSSPYFRLVEQGPKILHEFLENGIFKNTPQDSIIIHTLTGRVLLENRSAVFIGYFFDKDEAINFVEKSLKENKKVYLFETYQCEVFPKRCDKINAKFKFTPLKLKEGQSVGLDLSKVELLSATASAGEK